MSMSLGNQFFIKSRTQNETDKSLNDSVVVAGQLNDKLTNTAWVSRWGTANVLSTYGSFTNVTFPAGNVNTSLMSFNNGSYIRLGTYLVGTMSFNITVNAGIDFSFFVLCNQFTTTQATSPNVGEAVITPIGVVAPSAIVVLVAGQNHIMIRCLGNAGAAAVTVVARFVISES